MYQVLIYFITIQQSFLLSINSIQLYHTKNRSIKKQLKLLTQSYSVEKMIQNQYQLIYYQLINQILYQYYLSSNIIQLKHIYLKSDCLMNNSSLLTTTKDGILIK